MRCGLLMMRPFWVSNFFLSYFVTHILSLFLDQFCKLFVLINSYSISHPLSFVSNPNCSYCSTTQFEASSTNNYIWYISLGLCLSQASGFGKPWIQAWLRISKAQAHQSQAQYITSCHAHRWAPTEQHSTGNSWPHQDTQQAHQRVWQAHTHTCHANAIELSNNGSRGAIATSAATATMTPTPWATPASSTPSYPCWKQIPTSWAQWHEAQTQQAQSQTPSNWHGAGMFKTPTLAQPTTTWVAFSVRS